MTRLLCFFLGHALIRQRQTVDGIPNVLCDVCTRRPCNWYAPVANWRTSDEHATAKRQGHIKRFRLRREPATSGLRRVK